MTLATVALLAAAGVAVACGGAGGGSAPPTPDPDVVTISAGELTQYREEASEYQMALLGDGVLTAAEYEAAALAYLQCVEAGGHTLVNELDRSGTGKYLFIFQSPNTADGSALPRCRAEHLDTIDLIWARHVGNLPDVRKNFEAANEAMIACLREAGAPDVPDNAKSVDYLPLFSNAHPDFTGEYQQVFFDCQADIAEHYKIPGFVG